MPRIPRAVLLQAHNKSPLLPLVLRGTRGLPSATRELRWIVEHVKEGNRSELLSPTGETQKILQLCKRRERGEPLQYILGTQPFGELSIKCRPGVLIPRPETETYTSHLAKLLLQGQWLHRDLYPERFDVGNVTDGKSPVEPLKILDLCSGSGCISLLLYSLLSKKFPNIQIRGYDISEKALKLSKENLRDAERDHFHHPCPVEFRHQDIFGPDETLRIDPESKSVDIIISNPPYIDPYHFNTTTSRSVRNFEPRLALVPRGMDAAAVYRRLIQIHEYLGSRVLVMETSGPEQCLEIAAMAREMCHKTNEVVLWKDWLGDHPERDIRGVCERFVGNRYRTSGSGNLRTVVLIRHSK